MRWGIVLVMSGLLAATGAQAQDRDAEFTAAVEKCWNRPHSDEPTPKLVWDVEIDGRGQLLDITAETPKPEGAYGRSLVESLKRGLMRCTPYDFPAGVYKVTFDKNTKGGKSLDPYK